MTFDELSLDPKVLAAVADAGYTTPTAIQEHAIPHALQGRDVLGIAQTGTGKTASFTLPMLTLLAKGRARARMPRSLVLCPTRELAAQVAENFETYSKNIKLSMALLIGGVSFNDQDKKIDRGVDVLIATPGRLLDHFERGKLMLSGIEIMVVDEADRMLDMGFIPDIERIFKLTPFTRQTLFFSATMPPEIQRITNEFLHNPERVEVARASSAAETVTQLIQPVAVRGRDGVPKAKRAALRALLNQEGESLTNAIIFCNRKRDVTTLHRSLEKHGFDAGSLHGDLDQRVRMQVLDSFRDGKLRLLVASDVAARGLDIPAVSHVINFDVPTHPEDYVHRIGRTGRAGRSGKAFTMAIDADDKLVKRIEEMLGKEIPKAEPAGKEHIEGKPVESKSEPIASEDARPAEPVQEPTKPARAQESKRSSGRSESGESSRRGGRRRQSEEPAQKRGRGGRDRDRDNGRPVQGLGEHVPAFMLIPLPDLKRRKSTSDQVEDDGDEIADAA